MEDKLKLGQRHEQAGLGAEMSGLLVEDTKLSYGDVNTHNMLIHGDSLPVLKVLDKAFTGKIKCAYIDPPYNTGYRINADGKDVWYDDVLDHTAWLNMMEPRLVLLKRLLSDDGALIVQIDDREFARLYLLLAELFGENNLKTICVKMCEATGVKMATVINKGRIPRLKEFLIIAKKDGIRNLFVERVPKEKWDNEYKSLVLGVARDEISELKKIMQDGSSAKDIERADKICRKMYLKPVDVLFSGKNYTEEEKLNIKYQNAWRIVRDVATSAIAKRIADQKRLTTDAKFFIITTPRNRKYLIKSDYNVAALQPRIKLLFADDYLTVHPGDFWQDIKTTGLDNEGGVTFIKGKKPEALLKRIIGMASKEGDFVLDCFLGSGTTVAVAHKMDRNWIGIEMGNHCYTHALPRLKRVVDGTDQQGISKAVGWQGGGGFKFYKLIK